MSEDYRGLKLVGQLSSIALLILVATLIGVGLGRWLDGLFGTSPWLTLVLTLLGLFSGLYESVVMLIKATREDGD